MAARSTRRSGKAARLRGRRAALREVAFLRRVRLRLGLGRRLRTPRRSRTTRSCSARCRSRRPRARGCSRPTPPRARPWRGRCCELARESRVVVAARALSGGRRCRGAARAAGCSSAPACSSIGATPATRSSTTSSRRCRTTSARRSARSGARVADAGVTFGASPDARRASADWDFFTACYRRTYREHRSTPYLTREFFGMIAERMPEQRAARHRARARAGPIAAALDLFGGGALYGRYWGSVEYVPGPALRGLLLPGDRVLHRARHRRSSRAARRARTSTRAGSSPRRRAPSTGSRTPRSTAPWTSSSPRKARTSRRYVDELNEHSPFRRA